MKKFGGLFRLSKQRLGVDAVVGGEDGVSFFSGVGYYSTALKPVLLITSRIWATEIF